MKDDIRILEQIQDIVIEQDRLGAEYRSRRLVVTERLRSLCATPREHTAILALFGNMTSGDLDEAALEKWADKTLEERRRRL